MNYNIGDRIKDEKRDITLTDLRRYNGRLKYKYTCNKCGYDKGEISEPYLNKGHGCICCSNRVTVLGINTIWDTAQWMVRYVGEDIAKTHCCNSNKYIYPTCPDCGAVKDKKIPIYNIYLRHSIGCSCRDRISFPEKFMFSILDQLKNKGIIGCIESEKIYDWCKYYNPYKNKESFGRYDFVIEDMKLIIETDGEFHRRDNNMNGQSKEESEWIDGIKDKLAKDNGYKIIRISDKGDLKDNIIHSELNDIFDLSIIDWNKCLEFGLTNLMRLACKYKKENPNLTTVDISKIMNVSSVTVRNWLKIGSGLNLCSYNPKIDGKNKNNLQLICLNNGIIFESLRDCERKSEEILGVHIDRKSITRVCKNKQKSTKGYTFKFIKDLTEEEYIKYNVERKLEELKKGDVIE